MTTDWRSRLWEIEPKARLTSPPTDDEIAAVERAVGTAFPPDLRHLLRQTNGALDDGFGPVLPLAGRPTTPYADRSGRPAANGPVPLHGYSIQQYTALQRRLWLDDAGVALDTFVVIGLDIGGNPFGFFAGPDPAVRIRSVGHDDAAIADGAYDLEQYLRHYFDQCRWFDDER